MEKGQGMVLENFRSLWGRAWYGHGLNISLEYDDFVRCFVLKVLATDVATKRRFR